MKLGEHMIVEKLINIAISLEKKSVEFYTYLYNREHVEELRRIFLRLINFEKNHVKELDNFKVRFIDDLNNMGDPDMHLNKKMTNFYGYDYNNLSSTKEIILFAINEEANANKIYINLANKFSKNEEAKKALIKLASEEKAHKKYLQKIYKSLEH